MAIGLLVWIPLLWWLHISHLRRSAARLRSELLARQAERDHAASARQDALLQTVYGLATRVQAVIEVMPGEDPVRSQLSDILDRTDDVLDDGRQRMDEAGDPLPARSGLVDALTEAGRGYAYGHPARFLLVVEGAERELPPDTREGAFLLLTEAMKNAFRHAGAAEIALHLSFRRRRFRASLRDDGIGIAPGLLRAGRDGSAGIHAMRRQASSLGASLRIANLRAGGTEVDFILKTRSGCRASTP